MSFATHSTYEPKPPVSTFMRNPFKSASLSTSGRKFFPFTLVMRQSWLSNVNQRSERVKWNSYFFSKQFISLLLFFLLGFGLGLTPLRRQDAFHSLSFPWLTNSETKNEVSIEWNGLQTNMQASKDSGLRLEALTTEEGSTPALRTRHAEENDGFEKRLDTGQKSTNNATLWYQGLVPRKLVIAITPTYSGPLQAFYLTKLAQLLRLVPQPLLWLVVEMHGHSLETAALLKDSGIVYRHIICHTMVTMDKERDDYLRNMALAHIQERQLDGIVYFADEQNTYTLQLFEQLRRIRRFGTWMVGSLVHNKFKANLYGPVCRGYTVIGWHTNDKKRGKFLVDMSGFGFNSTMLWGRNSWQSPMTNSSHHLDSIREAFQKNLFLQEHIEDESQMQGLPSGCTKVMVWHLKLNALEMSYLTSWRFKNSLDATIGLI